MHRSTWTQKNMVS